MHILKNVFVLTSLLLTSNAMVFAASRNITVTNDTDYPTHIVAQGSDGFRFEQPVSAHARVTAIIRITNIAQAQEMLLKAIRDNSPYGIAHALEEGADVNREINGKKPLSLAWSLDRPDAYHYLVYCGAVY